MATAPLFCADLATLKAKLRLSGLAAASDADAIVNEAILTVRLSFVRHLGLSRVTALVALPFSEAPTTENEILRAVANVTEVEWVRFELMRTLPVLFQDASGDKGDIWNREAPFRQSGQSDLKRQADALYATILTNLELLSGDNTDGSDGAVQGGAMEADTAPPRPFDSVFPDGLSAVASPLYVMGGVL